MRKRGEGNHSGRCQCFKIAILGGGPAGIGVLVRAARLGVIDTLLGNKIKPGSSPQSLGLCLVDAGSLDSLGSGQLGTYAIRSNTFASKLVHHVLGDKHSATPSEGATGTVLEPLRYNAIVAQLLALGLAPAPLTVIARFMGKVAQIFFKLLRESKLSDCHCEMRVVKIQRVGQIWRIGLEKKSELSFEQSHIYAEHVVLALGAFQDVPLVAERYMTKVVSSNEVLSVNGIERVLVRARLRSSLVKVCIVGGAHSAFSVAWLFLHGENAQYHPRIAATSRARSSLSPCVKHIITRKTPMPPCGHLNGSALGSAESDTQETESSFVCVVSSNSRPHPGLLQKTASLSSQPLSDSEFTSRVNCKLPVNLAITMLHRSPVRVFYTSRRDADKDGYSDYRETNNHGQVHAFAGLRGDAKSFFNDILHGREQRVRLCQVKPGGSKSLIAKCMDKANIVVWATGYKSRIVPIYDEKDVPICFRVAHGQVQVDKLGRVLRAGLSPNNIVPNMYGNGHGFGLPAVYENGELDGSKGRADGIAVYMKQAASVILNAVLCDRHLKQHHNCVAPKY